MKRHGFTLVELLVAILIIIILTTIAFTAVNYSIEGDRIAGGARQVQSMLEGARDRAIYAGQPRGMRLVTDAAYVDAFGQQTGVSSLVFIGSPERLKTGMLHIEPNGAGDWVATPIPQANPAEPAANFQRLIDRGLLPEAPGYPRVRLMRYPNDAGEWLTLDLTDPTAARLTKPPATGVGDFDYELVLNPAVLPNQEPRLLPRGIVIDMRSAYVWKRIPELWIDGATFDDGGDGSDTPAERLNDTISFVPEMDILFNSRGTVEGALNYLPAVHLPLADVGDLTTGFRIETDALDLTGATPAPIENQNANATVRNANDEAIISVFTRTGGVVISEPDVLDANKDGIRDDPWRFAETGD